MKIRYNNKSNKTKYILYYLIEVGGGGGGVKKNYPTIKQSSARRNPEEKRGKILSHTIYQVGTKPFARHKIDRIKLGQKR